MLNTRTALIIFCTFLALAALVAPLSSPSVLAQGTPTPDPLGLTNTANYWEALLSIRYPASWPAPLFTTGQMALSASPGAALGGEITSPIVVIRLVDPINELYLPKDATFEEIATSVVLTPGRQFVIPVRGDSTLAGLSGQFIRFEGRNPQNDADTMFGLAVAFMLPDGRYAVFVATMPADQWGNFSTTIEDIRQSVALLHPRQFSAPRLDSLTNHTFTAGGLRFDLPTAWAETAIGDRAVLYGDPAYGAYVDGSGYAGGPLIVLQAIPLQATQTVNDALIELAGLTPEEAARIAPLKVDGISGAQVSFDDAAAGQSVILTAIPSRDGKVLNVFRFSAPAVLRDALKAFFEGVLGTVRLP